MSVSEFLAKETPEEIRDDILCALGGQKAALTYCERGRVDQAVTELRKSGHKQQAFWLDMYSVNGANV